MVDRRAEYVLGSSDEACIWQRSDRYLPAGVRLNNLSWNVRESLCYCTKKHGGICSVFDNQQWFHAVSSLYFV
jgi:hypothetical protein